MLLISGETAPRRNAKLLQRLIRVKGFLSVTALRRCAPSKHLPSECLTFQGGKAGWCSEKKRGRFISQAFLGGEVTDRDRGEELAVKKTGVGKDSMSALGELHCKIHRS